MGLVAFSAELCLRAIESLKCCVTDKFLGIILFPMISKSEKVITTVGFAIRNRMDMAVSLVVGASVQICLFVLPIVVLSAWAMGINMDLNFHFFDTVFCSLAILV